MQEAATWRTASSAGNQAAGDATFHGWTIERGLVGSRVCESWLAARGTERAVLRVLRQPFAADARARDEWLRASWAANRFHHGRVVKVIEQGTDARGAPVVVRAWVRGETLEEVIQRGTLDPMAALRLIEQVLDALEMAHAHGILHGALSPSNIVVTLRGSARLVDFATTPGLYARKPDDVDALAAARIGSFTPPERRQSPPALPSEASDVWSVGACLFFAMAGAPPADSRHEGDPWLAPGGTAAPPMPGRREDSDDIADVVRLALSRDPNDRYDSAYAMLGDIRRLLAGRKPKLDGALAPVPTQSAAQRVALPPSSSGTRGMRAEPAPQRPRSEWLGNVLLVLAIALLVGIATFVMVRERLADRSALAALDLIPANLLVQVRALHAEQHRRARDVAPSHSERVDDVLALGALTELAQREVLHGWQRRQARRFARIVLDRFEWLGRVRRRGEFGLFFERARVRILGQIGDGDPIPRQDRGTLDGVFQLAHVARPLARYEDAHRLCVDRLRTNAVLARKLVHEGLHEQGNVFDAFAERGAANGEDGEAKEEVFAKAGALHGLVQILVRGSENAHVDMDHVLAADARDVARLYGAKHFGLRDEVHVADLVEKERSTVGLLE